MDNDRELILKLRRELAIVSGDLHELKVLLLRVSATLAIVLMGIGLVLPVWSEEIDDQHLTARVLTVGFIALSGSDDEQAGTAPAIGFIGLVVVVLLLCGVLLNSVIAGAGGERAVVRNTIGTLAIIGSVIATLFSFVGWASDESDVSGGVGALVLLAGVVLAVAVLRYRPWQDLWIQQSGRR